MGNNIHVVIINGNPRAGKDSFVDRCRRCVAMNEYAKCVNISSVDIHKSLLKEIGWDGETKSNDVRNLLCEMKKFSIYHGDIPTKYMLNTIFRYLNNNSDDDYLIFCHIREVEEIKKLVRALNGLKCINISYSTLFIKRNINTNACCKSDEVNYNDYKYDFVINNDGTLDDLHKKAEYFINYLY